MPHHNQHGQRNFYLSFPQFYYLETLTEDTITQCLMSISYWWKARQFHPPGAQILSQQDQLAALLLKLPLIEVYNFFTGHCCLRRFSVLVPAAPESHCCYGELYIIRYWNHSPSNLGLQEPIIRRSSPLVPFGWYQINPAGSSWERKIIVQKPKKKAHCNEMKIE